MEPASASFVATFVDAAAGLNYTFRLSVWESDGSVALADVATKKAFLRRCVPPEGLKLQQLYIGARVVICARPLDITGYGDEATRRRLANTRGSTLLVVLPDAYHHAGKIVDAVYAEGLTIGRMLMVKWTLEEVAALLDGSATKVPASAFVGDVALAMEVTGDDVISRTHSRVGPLSLDDARAAAPSSIRAVFGPLCGGSPCVYTSPSIERAGTELSYVFERKQRPTAVYTHCAVCIVKPHVVAKGLLGVILDRILSQHMEISALRSAVLTRADATDYLEAYRGVAPEYDRWVAELASGPSVIVEVRGDDIVTRLRELAGPYDPEIARALRPDTLRAAHGVDATRNAVHVTDVAVDGPLESKFFFHVLA